MSSEDELKAKIAKLESENEELKKKATQALSFKVSQKGGVSVYGLGRFPVTLYKEQWEKLLDVKDGILAFIEKHTSELKTKNS